MLRHECMKSIADAVGDALVVTTNGGASSDWQGSVEPERHAFQMQTKTLGLCSSIALGMALALPHRRVIAFDGDGSVLMNASTLATIGRHRPPNLLHVVFDNGSYEASGEQPTHTGAARGEGREVDLAAMARGAGVPRTSLVRGVEEFSRAVRAWLDEPDCTFIQAVVELGRLRRPSLYGEVENKYRFLRAVERSEGLKILGAPLPGSMTTG